MRESKTALDAGVFTYEVSDDALEAAAGDSRGLFCSCVSVPG